MKKKNVKTLKIKKVSISNFNLETIKGGVTGTTCEVTNKYYRTCYVTCYPQTWWDWNCPNTVVVCDH